MDLFRDTHSIDRMQSVSKGESGPERNTLHRHSVDQLRRREALKYGVVSFFGLSNFVD